MSIELLLYFIDFLKSLGTLLDIITIFYLISSIVCACIAAAASREAGDKEDRDKFYSYGKRCFKRFLVIGILSLFIPSPSTMYMMVGSRYLKDSNLPAKVEELFNKKIDELLQKK